MNLESARVVLRPRTASEILDLAFRFAAGLGSSVYLRLAAIVVPPCLLVCGAAYFASDGNWPVVWCVAAMLAAVAQGVFTVAASRLLFTAEPSTREILHTSLRRLPALIGGLLLHAMWLALGSLMLVGGIYIWVRHTYLYEAVLLEQQSPLAALTRSSALFRGKAGAATTVCMLSALLVGLGIVVGETLLSNLVSWVLQLGEPFGELWDDGGSAYALLGFFAALPLVATARFLAYIDGRTRQDGWDIQLRFMAIAAAQPPEEASL